MQTMLDSVAAFLSRFYIVGNKIPKTTGISDDVDHPKSRWVTYWAERFGPLVDTNPGKPFRSFWSHSKKPHVIL